MPDKVDDRPGDEGGVKGGPPVSQNRERCSDADAEGDGEAVLLNRDEVDLGPSDRKGGERRDDDDEQGTKSPKEEEEGKEEDRRGDAREKRSSVMGEQGTSWEDMAGSKGARQGRRKSGCCQGRDHSPFVRLQCSWFGDDSLGKTPDNRARVSIKGNYIPEITKSSLTPSRSFRSFGTNICQCNYAGFIGVIYLCVLGTTPDM